jgi:hypothetical protein
MSVYHCVHIDKRTVIEEGRSKDPLRVFSQIEWMLVDNCVSVRVGYERYEDLRSIRFSSRLQD